MARDVEPTMSDERSQLDPIESTLVELRAAETAGVFGRTRVDAEGLLRNCSPARTTSPWRFALRWVPVAAAVALVVGVWGTMFAWRTDDGRSGSAGVPTRSAMARNMNGEFVGCFAGPSEQRAADCLSYDYDSDGDVDLADFRAYQVAYAGPMHTH